MLQFCHISIPLKMIKMTHTIQNSILILNYDNALEETKNTLFANTIASFKALIEEKKIKGIFISLHHMTYTKETPLLEHLIKQLSKVSQKIATPIALGDYSKALFHLLKPLSAQTPLKLFQNINTATLFLNPKSFKKDLCVLLFEEDPTNADKLSTELGKLGYTIIHAKDMEDFKHKASLKNYDITITQNAFNLSANEHASTQKSLGLSRELIINLPTFIDTAVNTLVTTTGLEAQKIKHEIRPFNEKISEPSIIAVMKFKGAISGSFFLIFPQDVAIIAIDSMLGESINPEDTAAITDGVGEFCNIITGATKATLSNKEVKVLFELPKTYTSLKSAMGQVSCGNGIWIDMQLNSKPFYMFVAQ